MMQSYPEEAIMTSPMETARKANFIWVSNLLLKFIQYVHMNAYTTRYEQIASKNKKGLHLVICFNGEDYVLTKV